jgi:hypothetical protein
MVTAQLTTVAALVLDAATAAGARQATPRRVVQNLTLSGRYSVGNVTGDSRHRRQSTLQA